MKLDLQFYKKENDYSKISEQEEYIINNYIEKYEDTDYEKIFSDNICSEELYHLSTESQNVLNWYQFNSEQDILEIGGNLGELTQIFCNNCKTVTTIEPSLVKAQAISKRYKKENELNIIAGTIENITIEKKYDIITLVGSIERSKEIFGRSMNLRGIIKSLEQYLKPNGKFLIALDNKFGLRYFVGNPENILNKKFESLIGYNNEPEKIETYTKAKIENELNKIGYNYNFYYPLPDYRMPNVIFSDKQLPKYNSIDKYNPYYKENSDILSNEIDVFREILKTDENMFTFFANSFLVEVGKEKKDIIYKYISFNNLRKEKYRLITKIANDFVEKQIVNNEATEHYNNIKNNIQILNNRNVKTLDYIDNDKILSKYINQDFLLSSILTNELEKENYEKVDEIIEQYINILKIDSQQIKKIEGTIFDKYGIQVDESLLNNMNFVKHGLWDMTFKNCFYIDNELFFFDQEWNEENIPVEYILYRSIMYTISLRRFINIDKMLTKYNLQQYKSIFEQLDNELQEKIRDEKIWKFYSKNKYFNIDDTKQEIINLNLRNKSQEDYIEKIKMEKENCEKQNMKLKEQLNNTFYNKMKNGMKKIIRRK